MTQEQAEQAGWEFKMVGEAYVASHPGGDGKTAHHVSGNSLEEILAEIANLG